MFGKTKKLIALTVAAAVIFLFVSISHGQETTPQAKQDGGMGYSMFGRGTIDLSDLNSKLESKGYSAMSDKFFSAGGGGHRIFASGLIIGGEGHAVLGDEATSGNNKHSVNIGYGFFNLGYIVYSVQELRFYPLLGLGFGGMTFTIKEDVASLSLDDVLDNPGRKAEISTGGFLLNLAVGMDYLLKFGEDEKGKAGMVLGLRAGYTFSPFKGDWTMDELKISGAPKLGITGPYIRLMIGGGGFGK
jgi:hypothetical protein